jgi:polar amino acid transport system substrate-binding protein
VRRRWGTPLGGLLLVLLLLPGRVEAASAEAAPATAAPAAAAPAEKVLRVGISPFAPMVFEGPPPPRGFDISLWEALADRMEVETRYVWVEDFGDLMRRVARGEVDVALGGISITAARERQMEFSYSYLRTGLGILATTRSRALLERSRHPLLGPEGFTLERTLPLLLGTLLVVGVSGLLFWWIELRQDPLHAGRPGRAIVAAVYWAVVTMSTVGYGDYTPKRAAGKLLALFLIFSGIGLFGAVVARMSSVLTVAQLRDLRPHPRELRGVEVATLAESSAVPVIRHFGGIVHPYPRLEGAIEALEKGEVEAVVSDWPALSYHVNLAGDAALVLSEEPFDEQLYALALPPGSAWRKPINLALLRLREDGMLARLVTNYFGEDFRLNNIVSNE